jgi:hypothetical protein
MALACAATVVTLLLSPPLAAAEDSDKPEAGQVDREPRTWQSDHKGNFVYQPDRYPYQYAQPVYVPPPVYYDRPLSPGIVLFFPFDYRR